MGRRQDVRTSARFPLTGCNNNQTQTTGGRQPNQGNQGSPAASSADPFLVALRSCALERGAGSERSPTTCSKADPWRRGRVARNAEALLAEWERPLASRGGRRARRRRRRAASCPSSRETEGGRRLLAVFATPDYLARPDEGASSGRCTCAGTGRAARRDHRVPRDTGKPRRDDLATWPRPLRGYAASRHSSGTGYRRGDAAEPALEDDQGDAADAGGPVPRAGAAHRGCQALRHGLGADGWCWLAANPQCRAHKKKKISLSKK